MTSEFAILVISPQSFVSNAQIATSDGQHATCAKYIVRDRKGFVYPANMNTASLLQMLSDMTSQVGLLDKWTERLGDLSGSFKHL